MMIVLAYSLLTRGTYGGISAPWSLESYQRFADPIYLGILWRSFWIAGASTVISLLLGFPLALFISRAGKRKNLYLSLVILPFWTSFLIRTYAWITILQSQGLLNATLKALHLGPIEILYTPTAVVIGLVYSYLPFMILPIYGSIEKLDPSLLEAALAG